MQTLLILGGFGFISSNVLSYIDEHLKNVYQVIIFDKLQHHPHGLRFNCVKKVYSGDFTNENCIEQIFSENKIDIVLHLLSTTIPVMPNNAQYDIESNLVPTIKLLGIMDRYKVNDIIFMSSGGTIYGDHLHKLHSEDEAVFPKSSYGIVKLAIEIYLLSYSELYGFNTLILRLSNPFGRYHYNDCQGVINIAVRKALNGEPFKIWGTGDGIKDYIYVDDVCDIIFRLIEGGVKTNVLNVAAGSAHSINEIANIIKEQIPSFTSEHIKAALLDVQSFELDVTKLRLAIGGTYRFTPFEEVIRKTIKWEKNNI